MSFVLPVATYPFGCEALEGFTNILELNAYWDGTRGKNYTVHPDGRFLFLRMAGGDDGLQQVNVVLNWFEELKQRVPTEGR